MKAPRHTLWTLFYVNCVISAFTFGGGYVVIPMLRKHFVAKRPWLTEEDLMDIAAISQSTPGAIAVNMSSLVGYRIAGIRGALVSCVGSVLPPLVLLSVISHFYALFEQNTVIRAILRGMEAGVAAIIVDLVWSMTHAIYEKKKPLYTAMVPAAFLLTFVLNVPVLAVLLGSVAVSIAWMFMQKEKGVKTHG